VGSAGEAEPRYECDFVARMGGFLTLRLRDIVAFPSLWLTREIRHSDFDDFEVSICILCAENSDNAACDEEIVIEHMASQSQPPRFVFQHCLSCRAIRGEVFPAGRRCGYPLLNHVSVVTILTSTLGVHLSKYPLRYSVSTAYPYTPYQRPNIAVPVVHPAPSRLSGPSLLLSVTQQSAWVFASFIDQHLHTMISSASTAGFSFASRRKYISPYCCW
jgi:hypothetical protein